MPSHSLHKFLFWWMLLGHLCGLTQRVSLRWYRLPRVPFERDCQGHAGVLDKLSHLLWIGRRLVLGLTLPGNDTLALVSVGFASAAFTNGAGSFLLPCLMFLFDLLKNAPKVTLSYTRLGSCGWEKPVVTAGKALPCCWLWGAARSLCLLDLGSWG